MDVAWKYQLPAIILSDRTLNDDSQSFVADEVPPLPRLSQKVWDGAAENDASGPAYTRYLTTEDGVSPLAFPGREGATVKVNTYTHDEHGISAEDPETTVKMQDKWARKGRALAEELDTLRQVNVYGDPKSARSVVTWGSPTGAMREVGELIGVRVVQPVVLWPFPARQLKQALVGSARVAVLEMNSTGQLAGLMERHGLNADVGILRYDGRPYGVGDLRRQVEKALA